MEKSYGVFVPEPTLIEDEWPSQIRWAMAFVFPVDGTLDKVYVTPMRHGATSYVDTPVEIAIFVMDDWSYLPPVAEVEFAENFASTTEHHIASLDIAVEQGEFVFVGIYDPTGSAPTFPPALWRVVVTET